MFVSSNLLLQKQTNKTPSVFHIGCFPQMLGNFWLSAYITDWGIKKLSMIWHARERFIHCYNKRLAHFLGGTSVCSVFQRSFQLLLGGIHLAAPVGIKLGEERTSLQLNR